MLVIGGAHLNSHMGPCVLNDIANMKSRHVQSWGRAGLVGWAGYTSPVQGQVGKCQHYPAQSVQGQLCLNSPLLQNFLLGKELLTSEECTRESWLNPVSHNNSPECVFILIFSYFIVNVCYVNSFVWSMGQIGFSKALSLLSRTWNVKKCPK